MSPIESKYKLMILILNNEKMSNTAQSGLKTDLFISTSLFIYFKEAD